MSHRELKAQKSWNICSVVSRQNCNVRKRTWLPPHLPRLCSLSPCRLHVLCCRRLIALLVFQGTSQNCRGRTIPALHKRGGQQRVVTSQAVPTFPLVRGVHRTRAAVLAESALRRCMLAVLGSRAHRRPSLALGDARSHHRAAPTRWTSPALAFGGKATVCLQPGRKAGSHLEGPVLRAQLGVLPQLHPHLRPAPAASPSAPAVREQAAQAPSTE